MTDDIAKLDEIKPCPSCGAMPCDWTNNPHVPENCRGWFYFPIEMPLTAEGMGPATVGKDAARITYEVWDQFLDSHGSFDFLPDAINEAMRLNRENPS